MSERFRVYLAYFLVCTIWGSTWLVIKIGLETMTPLLAAGCRFSVASALLFVLIKTQRVKVPFDRSDRVFYVIVALTSFSVMMLFCDEKMRMPAPVPFAGSPV